MLRLWGLLDFDAEIFVPHDFHSLPRGYHKQKSKESDQAHIMTSQALLVEVTSYSFAECIFLPHPYVGCIVPCHNDVAVYCLF